MALQRKNRVRLIAALAAVGLFATACGNETDESGDAESPSDSASDDGSASQDGSAADAGDGIVSTNISQPESLTPINNTESEGQQVIDALFTGLVDVDENNELVLQHAESIETEDNVTFTVTLKEGWTFHDGTPVTAQSYVDAWNYATYGPNAQSTSGQLAGIAGYADVQCGTVEQENEETGETEQVADCDASPPTAETLSGLTVDSNTQFTVELSEPTSFFPTQLKASGFLPLPEVFYEDPAAYDRAPVGNGPLMMDGEWQDDVVINTVAYPDYQGDDAVSVDGVEFVIYAAIETAVTDLVAGNLDIVNGVPEEQWEDTIAQVPNSDLSDDSGINYIGFPTYVEPLDDPTMRAALSMAIDREAISEGVFDGLGAPAGNFYSPVIPGYEEEVCDNWEYNPDMAAQLFEEAGGVEALGDTIEVWFNEGGGHDLWMDTVITQWEQVLGIPASSVSFQQLPFAEYLEVADSQQFTGPFRLGWGASYLHPQYYAQLAMQLTSDEGGNNAMFWESEDFDTAISDALAIADFEESLPAWQEVMDVACAETPLAPIYYGQNTYAWNDPVEGVFIDAFGVIDYESLSVS